MRMLSDPAARFYGTPRYIGFADTADELTEIVRDVRREALRRVESGPISVVVFQRPPDPDAREVT